MADLTFYDLTIPPFIRQLDNLSAFLKKGETWANENSIAEDKVLATRLAPDMAAMIYQIQRISDFMRKSVGRLVKKDSGVDVGSIEDKEQTYADMHARIDQTKKILESVPRSAFDGVKGSDEIVVVHHGNEMRFTAYHYLTFVAIPNVLFHVTTAYALFRHLGAPLGKTDFLGGWPTKD
jgi:uncharacterized protein